VSQTGRKQLGGKGKKGECVCPYGGGKKGETRYHKRGEKEKELTRRFNETNKGELHLGTKRVKGEKVSRLLELKRRRLQKEWAKKDWE